MGLFGGFSEGFNSMRDRKRQTQNDQLDQAKSMAALQESGYNFDPKTNTLSRSEQFGAVPEGFVNVRGKIVQDPTYTKPMSDVDQARADYYRSKSGKGTMELTPARQAIKDKATTALFGQMEGNAVKRKQIADAEEALPRVPTGFGGSMSLKWKNFTGSKDPVLGDWQKVKSVLTDAQLLNTAKTKGAISDKEMEEFKQAAANDDITSIPRLKSAFAKYKRKLESEQKGKVDAYFKQFGEDPRDGMMSEQQDSGFDPTNMSDDELRAIANGG